MVFEKWYHPFVMVVATSALLFTGVPAQAQPPEQAQQTEPDAMQNLLRWAFQVRVQQQQTPYTPVQTETNNMSGGKKRPKTFRLEKVLNDMRHMEEAARKAGIAGSGGDGFLLLAESSVSQSPVTPPKNITTAATLEAQLDTIIKELPHGTRWVKLMLPPVPAGKTLKGDDLADFALAQARMYGSVGEAVLPPGSVEVLSQTLGRDKADAVVPALNLRPVYLILNPDAHMAMLRQPLSFQTVDGQSVQIQMSAPNAFVEWGTLNENGGYVFGVPVIINKGTQP